jgi:hypothetical protein
MMRFSECLTKGGMFFSVYNVFTIPRAVRVLAGRLPTAAEAVPTFSPKSVGRIALESLGSIYWPEFGSETAESSIMKLLLALKAAIQGSRFLFSHQIQH